MRPTSQEGLKYCTCGKPGHVDLGEGAENRYPCRKCQWRLLGKPDWLFDEDE